MRMIHMRHRNRFQKMAHRISHVGTNVTAPYIARM